jgi:hypothetical protein
MDKFDIGLENYKKCINIKIEIYGSEHPSIADIYNDMALIYN